MGDIQDGHDKSVYDEELQQLVEQLKVAEREVPFVGIDWFRNEFLPHCGHSWAKDAERNGLLLQRAIDRCLVLILRVPNPGQPSDPIKAIMAIPSGTEKRGVKFTPIKIKGGPISDTVIEDRADRF